MQIVIDIPREKYDMVRNKTYCGIYDAVIYKAIANGTPLPEGHGRIADIDKVLEEMKVTRTYDIPFALGRVKPIIEADKEKRDADSD